MAPRLGRLGDEEERLSAQKGWESSSSSSPSSAQDARNRIPVGAAEAGTSGQWLMEGQEQLWRSRPSLQPYVTDPPEPSTPERTPSAARTGTVHSKRWGGQGCGAWPVGDAALGREHGLGLAALSSGTPSCPAIYHK